MLSYSSNSNSTSSNSSNISSSNSNSNSNNSSSSSSSSSNSTSNCLDPMLLFCYCWVLMQCDVCSVRALSRYCGRRDRPMCFCSNAVILLRLIQCIALQCNVCSFEQKLLQQGSSGSNIVLLQNNVCSVLECWAGSNVVMFLLQCYSSVSVSVAVLHCCPV